MSRKFGFASASTGWVEVVQMHPTTLFPRRYQTVLNVALEYQHLNSAHLDLLSFLRQSAGPSPSHKQTRTIDAPFVSGSTHSLKECSSFVHESAEPLKHLAESVETTSHSLDLPVYHSKEQAKQQPEVSQRDMRALADSCLRNCRHSIRHDHTDTSRTHASEPQPPSFDYPSGAVVVVEWTTDATYFFLRRQGHQDSRGADHLALQVVFHEDQSVCLVTQSEFVFFFPCSAVRHGSGRRSEHSASQAPVQFPFDERKFGAPSRMFTIATAPRGSQPVASPGKTKFQNQPWVDENDVAIPSHLPEVLFHGRRLMEHNFSVLATRTTKHTVAVTASNSHTSPVAPVPFSCEELVSQDLPPHG